MWIQADTCNWGISSSSFHLAPFSHFPLQVKELLSGRSGGYDDFNMLLAAIGTQKVEMFLAVMTTISDKLTEKKVRRCTLVEVAYLVLV